MADDHDIQHLYSGDPAAVARWHKVDRLAGWIAETPGAAQGGRFMSSDDPVLLGWEVIETHAREDGVFSLRNIDAGLHDAAARWAGRWGMECHTWQVFFAQGSDIAGARRRSRMADSVTATVSARPPPQDVAAAIAFMQANGVVAFSPRILLGRAGPSALATARDETGHLQGVAFGYFPCNRFSPWHRTAWCGLVAVAETARGAGVGRAVNDLVVDAMIETHGAESVVEFVGAYNTASRRMVEGSGLRFRPDVVTCGISTGGRATR